MNTSSPFEKLKAFALQYNGQGKVIKGNRFEYDDDDLSFTCNQRTIGNLNFEMIGTNNRFEDEANDCVVRHFAYCFEVPYELAHEYVAEKLKRKRRDGVYNTEAKITKLQKEVVFDKTITKIKNIVNPKSKRNHTVGSFSKQFDRGVYLLLLSDHMLTVQDRVIIDDPNYCTIGGARRTVIAAFEIS